ncbi:DUF6193 family natural product biosynthesis protein [Streptomyces sp. NBC_01353]|uniref:DUF6193 family natural product biosynthesis protein n=1 Tax=Streptomyces sp. NBC_01353 TaxID=2903835 RepID=UPI002E343920|nr:DUF6193 family natural product biosynthesis protein [Streptomyces sp. NBC_01353]
MARQSVPSNSYPAKRDNTSRRPGVVEGHVNRVKTLKRGTGLAIEPLHNGRFIVRRRNPFAVIGEVDTAEEAVTLVLELLPTGSEPVITSSEDERV